MQEFQKAWICVGRGWQIVKQEFSVHLSQLSCNLVIVKVKEHKYSNDERSEGEKGRKFVPQITFFVIKMQTCQIPLGLDSPGGQGFPCRSLLGSNSLHPRHAQTLTDVVRD